MVKCSECKEVYHENATHCPNCGTEKSITGYAAIGTIETVSIAHPKLTTGFSTIGRTTYATFGDRVIAWLIDVAIICVVSVLSRAIFGDFGTAISFIATACFYGYFESSSHMGTPGKIFRHLKVCGVDGSRISFLRGVCRYLAKIPSAVILGIGYLFPLFTSKKQTLHDLMVDCIVIKIAN